MGSWGIHQHLKPRAFRGSGFGMLEKKIEENKGNALESAAIEGDSPVLEIQIEFRMYPSSTEHEEFRVNLPGPPGKAKYDLSPIVYPVP